MNIIYHKGNGLIECAISEKQDYKVYFENFPEEFINNLGVIKAKNVPVNLKEYKVNNGKLVKMTDNEIQEINTYGRILTEEERLLNKLKPTPKEVQKAENTIEILTLIQEVI